MSAVKQIPKEKIVAAALEEVREKGMASLNVRALAARLGCSTRPVYLSFGGMEEVKAAVAGRISEIYGEYLNREAAKGNYPPYKSYGMAYIRFAREERQFFIYKFMRDRTDNEKTDKEEFDSVITAVVNGTGLDYESARLFHLESWIFVHGIAVMLATSYITLDEELISGMLTDMFEGLKARYATKKG